MKRSILPATIVAVAAAVVLFVLTFRVKGITGDWLPVVEPRDGRLSTLPRSRRGFGPARPAARPRLEGEPTAAPLEATGRRRLVGVRDRRRHGLHAGAARRARDRRRLRPLCLDPETGARRWKGGRYGHGNLLVVGDLLLVQTERGEMVLVEPTPEEHQELGRFLALRGKAWNPFALAGGHLLVRNDAEAALWELPLEPRAAS